MTNVTVNLAPVTRVEHSASLTMLGGLVVKGGTVRRGKGTAHNFHTVLRPSRVIRRKDGRYTIQSHAFPSYTITVTSVDLIAAWGKDDKPVDLTINV